VSPVAHWEGEAVGSHGSSATKHPIAIEHGGTSGHLAASGPASAAEPPAPVALALEDVEPPVPVLPVPTVGGQPAQ
jgi:hypothetical protein